MKSAGKILVIRGGAIGDFILTLPVFAALRAHFPDTHLEVLGYPRVASLALEHGLVDAVQPIDSRAVAGFFAGREFLLDQKTAEYFSSFNVIISYLYDPDENFKSNVAKKFRGHYVQGPHKPQDWGDKHATKVLLSPLEKLAIYEPDPIPKLPVPENPTHQRWVAVHPGSGSKSKNWPVAQWKHLLPLLNKELSAKLLVVSGESEGAEVNQLLPGLPEGTFHHAHGLPLPELSRMLAGAIGFVGHDSGISHLAAALGRPTIALWGPTNEAVWRPLGDHVKILKHPAGLAAMSPSRVLEECVSFFAKAA